MILHLILNAPFILLSENNAAVVHVIAPRGNLYSTAEDFLDAVEHTAANVGLYCSFKYGVILLVWFQLMTALCDYNGYSRRSHNGSLRLRK